MDMEDQKRQAAKDFAEYWQDKGYEKGESQKFWLSLLRDVYGVSHPERYISFEDQVHLDHTSFIDGMIPSTHVMIEQKGRNKNLKAAIKQSDGSLLTPFVQAKRYITELPVSMHPKYVITCNFQEFLIYDMDNPQGEPEQLLLKNLPKEYYRLNFLVNEKSKVLKQEEEISVKAGDLVGKMYDALRKQYLDPDSNHAQKSLNILCVRLVFCLYAEDAGVFGSHSQFHDYLETYRTRNLRDALIKLFRILDQKPEDRDPYEAPELLAFPYVNGGLFADENIEIPRIDEEIAELLIKECSEQFDWSEISPTIFGAVFESTLNPDTRRKGGMHYTSIENIHKVIDPLFLDDLKKELEEIKSIQVENTRKKSLVAYQEKLASLKFLDPACGSGNFLTETYLSLRKLENEAVSCYYEGQMVLGDFVDPIKVSISQFYGIEINDFAVTVAKTALWIAESQMIQETQKIVHMDIDFLPLTTNAFIHEGNALRMDWNNVLPHGACSVIIGNPPFRGYSLQTKEQKADILSIYVDENGKPYKAAGKIDYVAGWYFKAAQYMQRTSIRAAFVSTNSITQGEQVAGVWKPIMERFETHIDFAWRTFVWSSEASEKAAVHCVIVGFSDAPNNTDKIIFDGSTKKVVENINPYLIEAPMVFIDSRKKPISRVPEMVYGNKPTDGGFLFLTPAERNEAIKKEPSLNKYIKQIYGAKEYINNIERYCFWLENISPTEIKKSAFLKTRIEGVRKFRLNSPKKATQKSAETPYLFQEIRQPHNNYIIIPRHSSQTRRYVPVGFVSPDIIVNDAVQIIPDASLYMLGVISSNVHMAWMRAICGRIKSDYRYSKDIVYNNFPWPTPTPAQKAKIEKTAQAILDARAKYPDSSLADLYDELTMPPELRKAHQENDKAVMEAYGWNWRGMTESDCVAELMKLYQKLIDTEKEE
ncbi:class I SAM-dependent DNA methyltransferase [Acidaminococcus fermentans]